MQVQTVKHNLHKVKPSLPQMEETKENKERIKRMMITSNFDLRGIDSKIQVMRETPLCTGYMIFRLFEFECGNSIGDSFGQSELRC